MTEDMRKSAPLAERMRPQTLAAFVGQEHVLGAGRPLRILLESDAAPSIIFWGPPGTGKTTLARIVARTTQSTFVPLSAVTSGTADLKKIVAEALERRKLWNLRTTVFVDEIHRWNKAQQDALLPHVESGAITLIGATTENPSFSVNGALLSRCRVFLLELLTPAHIRVVLDRALADGERGIATWNVAFAEDALAYLAVIANGDARAALSMLEFVAQAARGRVGKKPVELTKAEVAAAVQKAHLLYDKTGEEHFNTISALHKTMRASDADAALYWLGRMLEAGEDPLYVARRLVRFASEDIGLADPHALLQAVAAYQAVSFLGMPECTVHLAQATAYLARAPKSRSLDTAYAAVVRDIREQTSAPVPLHLRNVEPVGAVADPPASKNNLPGPLAGKKYLD